MTNFWARMDFEADVNDGKMVIDIAEAAKVKLIVWSGLESVRDVSQGKITDVLHFDGKVRPSCIRDARLCKCETEAGKAGYRNSVRQGQEAAARQRSAWVLYVNVEALQADPSG